MDSQLKYNLKVMGLPETKLPKMKELRKQYLKLSLLRHPDKKSTGSGSDELFQELLNAYDFIGNLIKNCKNTDIDEEEEQARREFEESNFEKVNKTSVTIKIKTQHVKAWGKVFEEKYGCPVDISEAQNTKQWRVPYKLDDESSEVIKVKIWNLVSKEKSTMLIQGEHLKQYLNISFAEKVIPKLFIEVLKKLPKTVDSDYRSPRKRKIKRACKKCPSTFNSVSELNQHILDVHETNFNSCKLCGNKFSSQSVLEDHMRQEHDDSLLLEPNGSGDCNKGLEEISDIREHIENIQKEGIKTCDVCSKQFLCEDQLEEHIEMQHVRIQDTRMDASIVIINEIVQEICDMCEKRLKPGDKIEEHIIIEHVVEEYSISLKSCQVCSMEFHCEDKLNQHKEKHHAEESIVVDKFVELCDKCGECFENEEIFREHIRREHMVVDKNDMTMDHGTTTEEKCEECGVKEDKMVVLKRELEMYRKKAENLANGVSEKEVLVDSKIKEVEKMKKLLEKFEKESNKKIIDQKEELQESYKKVDKYIDENTILKEEIRTLKNLKEAKDNLAKSSVENNTNITLDDVTDESLNLEDDYVESFYWHQNNSRFKRTGPSSLPEAPVYRNKCDKCQNSFKTVNELSTHKKEHRDRPVFKCNKCSESTTTYNQLKKYIDIKHRAKNIICRFLKQSMCKKQDNCTFLHPRKPQACKLQLDCHFWPKCKFSHDENVMCKFQMNCQVLRCPYQHPSRMNKPCHFQNKCLNSRCNFMHFQAKNQNPFLGRNTNFGPLDPKEFPPLVKPSVWRPW